MPDEINFADNPVVFHNGEIKSFLKAIGHNQTAGLSQTGQMLVQLSQMEPRVAIANIVYSCSNFEHILPKGVGNVQDRTLS